MKLTNIFTRKLRARIAELEGQAVSWKLMVAIERLNVRLASGAVSASIVMQAGDEVTERREGAYGIVITRPITLDEGGSFELHSVSSDLVLDDAGQVATCVRVRVDGSTFYEYMSTVTSLHEALNFEPRPTDLPIVLVNGQQIAV
jgi:hypothetical protein